MAVITPSTFDPTKNYKLPRLQQGVPLVDADWNELGDALAFELRALLRWFIGDGVPEGIDPQIGPDAFRVDGTGVTNDFTIRSGMAAPPAGVTNYDLALEYAGRCTVDGRQLFILADFTYTSQPLHEAHGASADALAARLGVPKIAALPTTNAATMFTVYLDVWERLVTPSEDPSLILPALGVESCARMKREAVIRIRSGVGIPKSGDADFLAGHSYMPLAGINRPAGQAPVNAADVTDLRVKRLSLRNIAARVARLDSLALLPSFVSAGLQFTPEIGGVGSLITLNGLNFEKNPSVLVGSTAAQIIGTPIYNQIVIRVPSIAPGNYKITVSTFVGVVSDDQFTLVPAPVFAAAGSQFKPTVGPPGTVVTISGSNLNAPGLRVAFGTTDATTLIQSVTATQIVVPVHPSTPLGVTHITITTAGGSVVSADTFNVALTPGPPPIVGPPVAPQPIANA